MNRHNDEDTKLMGWLMTGAVHGTVDACGENLGGFEPVYDCVRGSRLLLSGAIDNKSKFLKVELGQQVSKKSQQKLKRDLIKHVKSQSMSFLNPLVSCWSSSCSNFDFSIPNCQNGFFDACVTLKFYSVDPSHRYLIHHWNAQNQVIDDVYGDLSSYQANCMHISGELMTFCVGGPRYFENNVCLENSFHHAPDNRNQARDIHH